MKVLRWEHRKKKKERNKNLNLKDLSTTGGNTCGVTRENSIDSTDDDVYDASGIDKKKTKKQKKNKLKGFVYKKRENRWRHKKKFP